MAFSGLWAFFYFITFVYMCVAWSKTEEVKFSFASSNIIGAIFFAFLSIFAWAGCAILAFQRFKAGGETAFTTDTIPEDGVPADTYNEAQYAQAPFNGGENPGDDFQKFWTTKKETSLQKDANQSQSKVLGVSRMGYQQQQVQY